MYILLTNNSMVPIYEQLADQVKQNIIDGSLREFLCASMRFAAYSLMPACLTTWMNQ